MLRNLRISAILALFLFLLLYLPGNSAGQWQSTSMINPPAGRYEHTGLSVGGKMLIWGGYYPIDHFLNDGHWYDPLTNTWTQISVQNAPIGRSRHTAIWTGQEMIVWGGESSGGGVTTNTGGRYSPATNAWTSVTTNNAPSSREMHSAVWTGSEMIIWGGCSAVFCSQIFNDGGRYNPTTNTWTLITGPAEFTPRFLHKAVWTGDRMIVWGGSTDPQGMSYDPDTNTWSPITTINAPAPTFLGSAVWTGEEMIVWGGCTNLVQTTPCTSYVNAGGRYNPTTNSWAQVTLSGAPAARHSHTAVWTGKKMIIWGGCGDECYDTGGAYDPATDTWETLVTANAPTPRAFHVAVWIGEAMTVWGGCDSGYCSADRAFLETGGQYAWPASTLYLPVVLRVQ